MAEGAEQGQRQAMDRVRWLTKTLDEERQRAERAGLGGWPSSGQPQAQTPHDSPAGWARAALEGNGAATPRPRRGRGNSKSTEAHGR